MRRYLRSLTLSLALAAGCSWGSGPGPGRPEEIAYILLIDQNGNDDTGHLPLYPGNPTTLQVRTYRADRSQITAVVGGATVDFAFTPPTYASVQATADPLSKIVSATDPPGTNGTLMITMHFPSDTLVKSFGPFYSLIH